MGLILNYRSEQLTSTQNSGFVYPACISNTSHNVSTSGSLVFQQQVSTVKMPRGLSLRLRSLNIIQIVSFWWPSAPTRYTGIQQKQNKGTQSDIFEASCYIATRWRLRKPHEIHLRNISKRFECTYLLPLVVAGSKSKNRDVWEK